jgi:hypothetical protein
MKSSYRILKLSSGEEIITKIVGKDKGKIIIENPMIFKTTFRPDMFGQSKEITFLGDWLSNTTSKVTKISEEFIMNWLTPTKEVAHLYDLEQTKRNKDIPKPKSSSKNPWAQPLDKPNGDLFSMLDELMKDTKDTDKNDQYVFMHMMLPPDALKDMMDSGLFDLDDLEDDLLDQLENGDIEDSIFGETNDDLYTGEDVSSPEYGNRWTDWDPNPFNNDYN